MKLSSIFTTSMVALAGLDNIASAESFCARKKRPGDAWRWEIHIDEVEDVSDTCAALWKGLKGHEGPDGQEACIVDVPRGCAKSTYYENKKALHMWFKTTDEWCDDRMIATAFWNATRNKYGAILCQQKKEDWIFRPERNTTGSA